MPPSLIEPAFTESSAAAPCSSCPVFQRSVNDNRRFKDLRSVLWRINLGILPSSSSSIDDIRRVTADSRRRYAGLRKHLLVDPHIPKNVGTSDLVVDNPLSQNPDSIWGQFFRNAELEKMVDQDLTRLYPEHGSYFQTPGCQGMLRRILLLWCLRHPEYGYRQGMHELLAPLLYVLHVDVERLSHVRELYEDIFTDKFDGLSFHDNDLTYNFDFTKSPDFMENEIDSDKNVTKPKSFDELDSDIQTIISLGDAYGAEGELGIVLSEKFMEHDGYCMFDALMSGSHGSVSMAEFFSPVSASGSQVSVAPDIEASGALYHLLSYVDSSLHSHLVELGVEPQYFALRWLRVLFGREFTLSDLLIIWDEIFASDNSKIHKSDEDDGSTYFGILCSARGAFISAFAVSMLLYLRSSLLATEYATLCLQRLQKFPENVNVDLKKMLEKAKSLQTLALSINTSSTHPSFGRPYDCSKSMVVRGHSHSLDSMSPNSLLNIVPERYWEEKWRTVLHREEELKQDDLKKPRPTQKKRWTEKVKLILPRSESVPCPTKREDTRINHKSYIRRRILEDLSRELGFDEDPDKLICREDSGNSDKVSVEECSKDDGDKDLDLNFAADESCVTANTGSEENLSIISDARSPHLRLNDIESEKSSVSSNSCVDDNIDNHCSSPVDPPLRISVLHENFSQNSELNDSKGNSVAEIREQKTPSGKLQWLWKFSRNAGVVGGTSEKGGSAEETTKSVNNESNRQKEGSSAADGPSLATCKGNAIDQNMMGSLKNLGHSMLEHIQVIESTFQQDRGLVGKGQVTAMTALKELRKISNLLSEM